MDRNTTFGLVLIFVILVVFSYLNRPSKEEIEEAKHRRDSIALVQAQQQAEAEKAAQAALMQEKADAGASEEKDVADEMKNLYGDFGVAAVGEDETYVLENNLVKVNISTKGGMIKSVELKDYKRHDGSNLLLFEEDKTDFNLTFFAQNRTINSEELFFTPSSNIKNIVITGAEIPKGREGKEKYNDENGLNETKSLTMRLEIDENRYIEYVYKIAYNSYMVDFDIKTKGMDDLINASSGYLSFQFGYEMPRQERASQYGEDRYATVYYKHTDENPDKLNQQKADEKNLTTKIKWIGFKQLFFSTMIISDDYFSNALVKKDKADKDSPTLGYYSADIGLPYNGEKTIDYDMGFYFGPNHYGTLKQYGEDYEKLIALGWPVVREVNRYLIIPIFNFLRRYIDNFGIIILLLTIFIKSVVFPFTYRSYQSQAKMRALKPEIDAINSKISKEKAAERQQATMDLYRKAGVNPMGGCLPMLFQMPFLIAMFYFFPGSIELRQESFLWASDLSTYDSILNLPFSIPMYGDHVSLFCLLMTAASLVQTIMTQKTQSQEGMPGMKYMMYFMPIFFMMILNSYASGLSYYYFLATLITIGQTYLIRRTIDEDKLRTQLLNTSKKKPKKKSSFQQRLEQMAKEQQQNTRKR